MVFACSRVKPRAPNAGIELVSRTYFSLTALFFSLSLGWGQPVWLVGLPPPPADGKTPARLISVIYKDGPDRAWLRSLFIHETAHHLFPSAPHHVVHAFE